MRGDREAGKEQPFASILAESDAGDVRHVEVAGRHRLVHVGGNACEGSDAGEATFVPLAPEQPLVDRPDVEVVDDAKPDGPPVPWLGHAVAARQGACVTGDHGRSSVAGSWGSVTPTERNSRVRSGGSTSSRRSGQPVTSQRTTSSLMAPNQAHETVSVSKGGSAPQATMRSRWP